MAETETRLAHARSASSEKLKTLVHDASEDILLALVENPNLEEAHVRRLLDRLDLPAEVVGAIGGQGKWMASESVRLGLARHPRAPKIIALAAARQLYLFDLVRLSLAPSAPGDIRRAAETIIVTRVPQLPVGQKLTLARRGPARVAGALLAEGHPQVIKLALQNAFLTESQVLRVLADSRVPERVVAAIAQHPKWSCRYNVRAALVRNPQTPPPSVLAFLPDLTLRDLTDISRLEGLPLHVRRYIEQERSRRGHGLGKHG
jgi:hypothetical protein